MLLELLPLVVIYLLIGLVVTMLAGGRDPLSPGPQWLIVLWPVPVFVAIVGIAILSVMPD